jgi:hypothetical protein
MVQVEVAKNIEGCFSEKLLSYLACNQIWLYLPVDHCHFGYNTALPKKTNTAAASILKSRNKSGEISSWEKGFFFFFFLIFFSILWCS